MMYIFLSENELSMKDRIQRILPSIILDVALPSLDVYSDISLIIGWLRWNPWGSREYNYGLMMIVPVLLQILSSIYKWYQIDDPKTKKWSWILVIYQCWPQFRSLKVVRLLYKNDSRAEEEKKKMMRDVLSTEPYLEAWPSVMITTGIWMGELIRFRRNENDVFGELGSIKMGFYFSYSISILTASLGLTKLLLVGPCPILSDKGLLNGLFTWRFFLCFLGVLLSVATYYTVGPKNVQFCSLERNIQRKKLGFSRKLSIINMIMTNFMFVVTFCFIVFYDIAETGFKDGFFSTLGHFFIWGFYTAPFLIFAFLFNMIFMALDLDCCCNRSQSCCPKFCCGPQCF